ATSSDTNWLLANGAGIPDFNPGSTQYAWLEAQLADAESKSQFTFVQFHHVPYSVGPHGFPAGNGGNNAGFDTQSGQPVRILTSLFQQYGVDAVFSGHDEQYQHSLVSGIHFFDVGIGGDGLRGPSSGTDGSTGLASTNPYQVFTAHLDAPEVWSGVQLVSGGKHYGHMEVDVFIDTDGFWKASLEAAYSFPLMDSSGNVTGWERRVYSDAVTLVGAEANVAPVLDADGSPTLDSILGNVTNANNPGTLISDIIARMGPNGGITDANTNPSFGIAINGAQSTNGVWEYSTDGGTSWSNIGPVSNDAARLLASDANTRLRFVPNAGFLGEVKIAFVAWDQTDGVNGGTGITKGRGGNSTFSAAYEYASIFVVNAAPVLNNSGNPMLDQITLNLPNGSNPGTLVSDLIVRMGPSGGITDANPGALQGIAINGLSETANGVWEFTVNNGTNWTPIAVTGNFNARLLYADGNTRVRYVPNNGFLGEPKLAFVGWDRTTGANGGVASVNNRGGATPYSVAYELASIKVVNTAPVLTPSNSSTFDGILMNVPNGSNPGTLVSTLISRMGPSGGITDADPGSLQGIAVVGMSGTSTGTWQYTINGGATWAALGAPSSTVARLLAADGNTRIRYVPNAGFVGIAKIAFVGWDQTSGTNGAIVNAAGRGGTKPYSVAYDLATINVVASSTVLLSSSASSFGENGDSTTITASLTAPVDHDVYVTLGLGGTAGNNTGYRVTSNSSPIAIDGDFGDWDNNPNVVWGTDPFNDTHDTDTNGAGNTPLYVNHPDVDLRKFGVIHDDTNLYFYFESTGIIGRTQSSSVGTAGRYYVIVTMDVDQNDATGYQLHEGGYYPTTNGYDMNAEIEFYNAAFNTGHYLNHGATNQAEKDQAFADQSQGGYDPAHASDPTQGPFDPGFVNVLPGTYDYYTQWVYKNNDPANGGNDSITFVKDKGPVVLGIIETNLSADGHKLEMIVPYKGFLKDQLDNAIVDIGKSLDLSFSLEASGELAPGGQWASDTADPLNGYLLTAADETPVHVIRIPAGQTSGSLTITGLDDGVANPGRTAVVSVTDVVGTTESGQQEVTLDVIDDEV
ncbi:MAG: hypothetical protein KDA68_08670, partial [Planctomycetaceae bacterium]|nr:hypothetical protein [Planctomycetaceae bacterium]